MRARQELAAGGGGAGASGLMPALLQLPEASPEDKTIGGLQKEMSIARPAAPAATGVQAMVCDNLPTTTIFTPAVINTEPDGSSLDSDQQRSATDASALVSAGVHLIYAAHNTDSTNTRTSGAGAAAGAGTTQVMQDSLQSQPGGPWVMLNAGAAQATSSNAMTQHSSIIVGNGVQMPACYAAGSTMFRAVQGMLLSSGTATATATGTGFATHPTIHQQGILWEAVKTGIISNNSCDATCNTYGNSTAARMLQSDDPISAQRYSAGWGVGAPPAPAPVPATGDGGVMSPGLPWQPVVKMPNMSMVLGWDVRIIKVRVCTTRQQGVHVYIFPPPGCEAPDMVCMLWCAPLQDSIKGSGGFGVVVEGLDAQVGDV